jgi:hypothetical protein
MITAQSLPAIVNVLRRMHEGLEAAYLDPPDISAATDRVGFEKATLDWHHRFVRLWQVVAHAHWCLRELLRSPECVKFYLDRLDQNLPLPTRGKLREVWTWKFSMADRDRFQLAVQDAIAVLTAGGPKKPDSFEWRGHVCHDLGLCDMLLLTFLWNGGRRRQSANFEELRLDFWGHKTDSTIRSAVSRLNTRLEEAQIFLGLGTQNYTVVCTWGGE